MDDINSLLIMLENDTLSEYGAKELIDLMFDELNTRAATTEFLGGQLKDCKELNKCAI